MSHASELPTWAAVLTAMLVLIGAGLTLAGAIGTLRFGSFYERVHAPTLGTSWGPGAVALASNQQGATRDSVVLGPGDLGRVESDGGLTSQHGVDVAAHLAWIGGRLVFVDTPLREALPRLARWYGVAIRLGDSTIAARRYTASLKNEPLAQVLDLMARSVELRIGYVADTVVLYSQASVRSSSPSEGSRGD